MRLRDFLDEYVESLNLLRDSEFKSKTLNTFVREGHVYESRNSEGIPIFLLAVNVDDRHVEVVPLCWCWELATKYDVIVKFPHPLRETWIVQLDLAVEIPKEILYRFKEVGKISDTDLMLIKKVLNGEIEIPKNRRGKGYSDEIHSKFKEIEFKRHEWLFEVLLSSVDDLKKKVIFLIPSFKQVLEEHQLLVAASEKSLITKPFGEVIYNEKKGRVEIFIKEKFLEKRGTLFFDFDERKLVVFEGKLKDLVIVGVPKKLFNLFQCLDLEVENESSN